MPDSISPDVERFLERLTMVAESARDGGSAAQANAFDLIAAYISETHTAATLGPDDVTIMLSCLEGALATVKLVAKKELP